MNKLLVEGVDGVRRFSDANIQAAVEDALSHVTTDKPVAVVGHATLDGWKLSAAYRAGDDWTIMVAAYQDWGKPVTGEAKVVWTP